MANTITNAIRWLLSADSSGITQATTQAQKSFEKTGKAGESMLKQLKGAFGKRSDIAQWTALLTGGGAIAGINYAQDKIVGMIKSINEMNDAYAAGAITAGAYWEGIASHIPGWELGRAIREGIFHEDRQAAPYVKELDNVAKLLDEATAKSKALTDEMNKYHKAVEDTQSALQRKGLLLGIDDPEQKEAMSDYLDFMKRIEDADKNANNTAHTDRIAELEKAIPKLQKQWESTLKFDDEQTLKNAENELSQLNADKVKIFQDAQKLMDSISENYAQIAAARQRALDKKTTEDAIKNIKEIADAEAEYEEKRQEEFIDQLKKRKGYLEKEIEKSQEVPQYEAAYTPAAVIRGAKASYAPEIVNPLLAELKKHTTELGNINTALDNAGANEDDGSVEIAF